MYIIFIIYYFMFILISILCTQEQKLLLNSKMTTIYTHIVL